MEVKRLDLPRLDRRGKKLIQNAGRTPKFVSDDERVLMQVTAELGKLPSPAEGFEKAGLRDYTVFEPDEMHAGIVTCGGLCPGLNDVIRSVVMTLTHYFGVKRITGFCYGYAGLDPEPPVPPMSLNHESVSDIHRLGGTILGSSRGHPGTPQIVDTLVKHGVNVLFCIGGDGTLRGAHAIAMELADRKQPIAVIGIPKTIDNDIPSIYHSFGFQTAVEEAKRVVDAAHVEAKGALNGVGLVKLMGRDAGFVAADATRSSGDVNFCLTPEINFPMTGKNGFLECLKERLLTRRHAVVVVAEGAGTHLVGVGDECDASGNRRHNDIGVWLRAEINRAFKEWDLPVSVKYFDPSYLIRSVPADSEDSIFCAEFGRYAVAAAMTGRTDMLVGFWHGEFTHVPLKAIDGQKKQVNPNGRRWRSVVAGTGQPLEW